VGRRSDPRWRDAAALDLLRDRVVATLPRTYDGPLLLVGEPDRGAALPGRVVHRWDRGADRSGPGAPLPPTVEVAAAAIRMPRSKAELEFALRATAAHVRPGGLMLVYGANDEGTTSAGAALEALGVSPVTWAVGGRCRVVGGEIATPPAPLELGEVERASTLSGPHVDGLPWVDYPGVFAAGRLDAGTRLLLEGLEAFDPGTRVLDYGAGTGAIGAAALALGATEVTLLEPDALAALAARVNVPDARVVEGAGWSALPEEARWEVILANPPYHEGKAESVAPVVAFVSGLADRLAPGGEAHFVVQRRLPVERELTSRFEGVEVRADEGPFRVWSVTTEVPCSPV
jgi:16S rRNA (guanine1207-N2)-methyltransferase